MPTVVRPESIQTPLAQAELAIESDRLMRKFVEVLVMKSGLGTKLANIYLSGIETLRDFDQTPIDFSDRGQLVRVHHTLTGASRRKLEVLRYGGPYDRPMSFEMAVMESRVDREGKPDGTLHYHKQPVGVRPSEDDLFNNSRETADKLNTFINSF